MQFLDFKKKKIEDKINYLKLLIYFGRVDDHLADSERVFLEDLSERIGVSQEIFDRLIEEEPKKDDALFEAILALKSDNMVYSFFLDIIVLSTVDGVIQYKEHNMLVKVCNELDFDLKNMHNLLCFCMISSYTKIQDLEEPMYQGFLDIIIHWIQNLNVPIFEQTSFSLNKQIDKYLKLRFQGIEKKTTVA